MLAPALRLREGESLQPPRQLFVPLQRSFLAPFTVSATLLYHCRTARSGFRQAATTSCAVWFAYAIVSEEQVRSPAMPSA